MRLFKIEHNEKGIWYFTSKWKAAHWLGIEQSLLEYYIRVNKPYKGWSFDYTEDDEIFIKYINPSKQ